MNKKGFLYASLAYIGLLMAANSVDLRTDNEKYIDDIRTESVKKVFNDQRLPISERLIESPIKYLDNNGWTQPEASLYTECKEQAMKSNGGFDPFGNKKPGIIKHCMKHGL